MQWLWFPLLAAVQFQTSGLQPALEQAKTDGRPVLIDFYAEWCGPCKMMDQATWPDEKVASLSARFVCLRVDAEKGEGPELAKRFRVDGFPTIVFLDGSGEETGREVGFRAAESLAESMRQALASGGAESLDKLAAEAPEDAELQLTVARRLAKDKKWTEARAAFEGFIGKFKEFSALWQVQGELANVYLSLDDKPRALAAYQESARLAPDNVAALNGMAWFCATQRLALDEALTVAQRAVDLSKGAAPILDTLAELRFARGELDEALRVEEEAIAKEPDDSYYQEQRDKFLAAKKRST